MTLEFWLILGVGVLAGTVNTVVGGGTFLTMPLLDFCGLPAIQANATNRLAVTFQSVSGLRVFTRANYAWTRDLKLVLLAGLGGGLGALLAIALDPTEYRRVAGGILLVATIVFFIPRPPTQTDRSHEPDSSPPRRVTALLALLFGVYGGFLGAGVGVLFLLVMPVVSGRTLKQSIALKIFVVFVFSLVASLIYLVAGRVDAGAALPLILGNIAGGTLGGQIALKGSEEKLKFAVGLIAFVLALRLLLPS